MPQPQLLLIDAGSTRLKWATARLRGKISVRGEMATREATSNRIRTLLQKFPQHRVILASVVPRLIPHFRRALGKRLHVVNGTAPFLNLRFKYPNPSEIGADRLATAVAAHADGHWPVITVTCGTATAFTVLDAEGKLCGGVIAPGLQTQLASLLAATAQLPNTKLRPTHRYLARSTQEAIRAGVMLNFQGGVKEILSKLIESLPKHPKPRILLTGGNAPYLARVLDVPATLRPLLVFEGLRIIGARLP